MALLLKHALTYHCIVLLIEIRVLLLSLDKRQGKPVQKIQKKDTVSLTFEVKGYEIRFNKKDLSF